MKNLAIVFVSVGIAALCSGCAMTQKIDNAINETIAEHFSADPAPNNVPVPLPKPANAAPAIETAAAPATAAPATGGEENPLLYWFLSSR